MTDKWTKMGQALADEATQSQYPTTVDLRGSMPATILKIVGVLTSVLGVFLAFELSEFVVVGVFTSGLLTFCLGSLIQYVFDIRNLLIGSTENQYA